MISRMVTCTTIKRHDGTACSPHRHKSSEVTPSGNHAGVVSVRSQCRRSLTRAAGLMWTHFAPTPPRRNAPRVLLRGHKDPQRFYIGYIGRHLTNTKTN